MTKKFFAATAILAVGALSLYAGLGGFDVPQGSSSSTVSNSPSENRRPAAERTRTQPLSDTVSHWAEKNPSRPSGQNSKPVAQRPTPKPSKFQAVDPAFEDWLWQYGYDLSSADIILYLRTAEMSGERRARLLEFAMGELQESMAYFASREGIEFLESLLAENGTDAFLAARIGHTLRWLGREKSGDSDDRYIQRFAQAKSAQEKIGLVSATSDGPFLREVAFNHKEPTSVRAVAINNLLSVQRDDKTLKQLLDLTETQPELNATVIQASANQSRNMEEFMSVVETLRREGEATPENARMLGESFTRGVHPTWLWSMDAPSDPFVKQVLQAYQAQSRVSSRSFPVP